MKPAASGALSPRADKSARLHPKCFTTGRKNTPLAFTGPQIKSIVVNRIATIAQGRTFGSVMFYPPACERRGLHEPLFCRRSPEGKYAAVHSGCAKMNRSAVWEATLLPKTAVSKHSLVMVVRFDDR